MVIIGIGVVIILLAIAIFLLGKRVTAWIKARMIKGYTPDGRTIVNRCLFAPLILFAGILLVWVAVHGEQAGHISARYGSVYRSKTPDQFWFNEISVMIFGLLIVFAGIAAMYRSLKERKCTGTSAGLKKATKRSDIFGADG